MDARAVFGVGLLEAIAEAEIRALADPDDRDGDGISGRANDAWDVAAAEFRLGRFGWKASTPSVRQQAANAFHADIGITSSRFVAENCPAGQDACAAAANGAGPDGETEINEEREGGAVLFFAAGCQRCHTPRFTTGPHVIGALAGQTIFPYTDLLLHDLGNGLADDRPVFGASGSEWRTAPLWGIGLIPTVNGHTRLLHDGRARDIGEAILWHGGEAEASREAFRQLSAEERQALIDFINSL